MKKFFVIALLFFSFVFPQNTSSIYGVITDSNSGEPLIGANIIIQGTSIGSATGMIGDFTISNVEDGVYTLIVSYIGYENKIISNVIIDQKKDLELNISLETAVVSGEEVYVQADRRTGTNLEVFERKRIAVEVQDNISAEQISRSGDSHVADAVRRVTGVTIVDNKFLVVRGLGDRYSNAQMNSVGMPSPEADKRSVPLDLFSSSLIDGIDVAKSYTPNLPGTFGGGNVNIRTKLYPSRTTYKIKFGTSVNSNLMPGDAIVQNFNNNSDFMGYDIGRKKALPTEFDNELISYTTIPDTFRTDLTDYFINFIGDTVLNSTPERNNLWFSQVWKRQQSIPNVFLTNTKKASLPQNISGTYGTKFSINPDLEFGFLLDGTFSSKSSRTDDIYKRYTALNDPDYPGEKLLRPSYIDLERIHYSSGSNIGANASIGMTYRDVLRFGLRNVYTHTSKDNFSRASGLSGELVRSYNDDGTIDENGLMFMQSYKEKSINLTTFSIENQFAFGFIDNKIDFKYTYGKSNSYEPFITRSEWEYDSDNGMYSVYNRNGSRPGELITSDGNEKLMDISYDHTLKTYFGDFKFGFKMDRKDRAFGRRSLYLDWAMYPTLQFDSSKSHIDENNINGILGTNYWANSYDENGEIFINEGLYFSEQTSGFDAYNADEDVDAFYIMLNRDLSDKIQLSVGVRSENHIMTMRPYHPIESTNPSFVNTTGDTIGVEIENKSKNLLPAITLNYSLSDKMKIRSSYSETLARAQFREYAPYQFVEFLGADVALGFPYLKNSSIYSTDLRFEYFPSGLELISIGFFHKHFNNPIEESLVGKSGLGYYKSWQNGDYADINGFELEYRKNLNFIPSKFGFLFLNTNLTLSQSEVVVFDSVSVFRLSPSGIPETIPFVNPIDETSRPLQGQSNIVYNFGLNYKSQTGGELNLAFNTFSKRLVTLSGDIAGSIWELPFNSLNIVGSQKFGPFKISLSIKNLLSDDIERAHIFRDEIFTTTKYSPGRSFSIGLQFNN